LNINMYVNACQVINHAVNMQSAHVRYGSARRSSAARSIGH
jgi:hypothetical protein